MDDHPDDGFSVVGGSESEPHRLPGCLRVEIPASPCRTLHPHLRNHRLPDLAKLLQRKVVRTQDTNVRAGLDQGHRPGGAVLPQHLSGTVTPLRSQVRERAHFLLGPGGEGRLLP